MGSQSTKTYDIPERAYEELADRNKRIIPTRDIGTIAYATYDAPCGPDEIFAKTNRKIIPTRNDATMQYDDDPWGPDIDTIAYDTYDAPCGPDEIFAKTNRKIIPTRNDATMQYDDDPWGPDEILAKTNRKIIPTRNDATMQYDDDPWGPDEILAKTNRKIIPTRNDATMQYDAPSALTGQQCTTVQPKSATGNQSNDKPSHLCNFHAAQKAKRDQINEHEPHKLTKKKDDSSKVKLRTSFERCIDDQISIAKIEPIVPIRTKNKLKSVVKPPNKLNDLEDFIRNWTVWKEQLISFLAIEDEKNLRYHDWGNYFLNFMGPVGHQILNNLFFDEEDDKKDYAILMKKYDIFYNFLTTVKSDLDSTIEYIERLKDEAAQNITNVDKTLKEKIAKEIEKLHKERFIALARSKLPNFTFETTFNSLTLAEIAFLWEICEKSYLNNNRNCMYCGKFHPKGKCPAFGKECNRCKKKNHFSKYCPGLMYVTNCSFCGGNHEFKRCLAYGETCSKCGKLHHFSWKCSKEVLLSNCRFCGLSHLMDRCVCPARNSLCSICKQRGHYDIKCHKKQLTTKDISNK